MSITKPTRFAMTSTIAATIGVGALAMLLGFPSLHAIIFAVMTASLGAIWVVWLAQARVQPNSEAGSSETDSGAQTTAMIVTNFASGIADDSGHHSAGGHGPLT